MAAKLLPPHPWKIASGYKLGTLTRAVALLLGAAAVVVGISYWQYGEAAMIVNERAIWEDPKSVEVEADASGRSSSRLAMYSYHLDVSYDVGDRVVHRPLEFHCFGSIDKSGPRIVRYDPNDPSRFALNLAVEKSTGRWAHLIVMWGLLAGFLGGAIGAGGWRALQHFRYIASLETRGVELHCTLVSVEQEYDKKGNPTKNSIYRVTIPSKGEDARSPYGAPQSSYFLLPNGTHPLELGDKGDRVIVLLPFDIAIVPEPVVALRDDFYPLLLDADQQRAAKAKLAVRAQS